jgi:hypothetical protein
MRNLLITLSLLAAASMSYSQNAWQSRHVYLNADQKLVYTPDEKGNIIPDFSNVGFASGEKEIPSVEVVEELEPVPGDNRERIQEAINRVAARPFDANGYRGALLLKKGTYEVNGTLVISKSGIVIRGEGEGESGTVIRETAKRKLNLFSFEGNGRPEPEESTRVPVTEDFVPAGRKYIEIANSSLFKAGDSVLVYRPGTDNWVSDLKMDQIVERPGTNQWSASGYQFYFERIITAIEGNKIYLDNPVMMEMEKKYGGGFVMKYTFRGRISHCGIEYLRMESTYAGETDENHGWIAINFSKATQSWARNVISRYFGQGCVGVGNHSRNITVLDSQCLDPKSEITGGRRYSFACNGQLNLFKNCYSSEARHDYSTGARILGPNVFTRCVARNTHSDIGPHHRWSVGTLYDMIDTDGQINIQDRGNYGTGHGWAGVTQVVWNSKSPKTAVQNPWVSGKNYCIGLIGGKYGGRFPDRPDGVWEGLNQPGLVPESLYDAQLKERLSAK